MARAKKDKVDYFPHMVTGGKTIFILEQKFGNDGYAFWFKLLELLGDTKGHYFCTRNYSDWHFLIAKTRVTEQIATEILDTLAELDAIDGDLWKEKTIWVQKFVDNISDVYKKRKQEVPEKPSFCDSNNSLSEVSVPEMRQSKVKESKVNKSKEKENKKETSEVPSEDFRLLQQLSNLWSNCGYGMINSMTIDKLMSDIEIFSWPWVKEAIEIGNMRSKRSYSYVKGILNRWQVEGKEEKHESRGTNPGNTGKEERDYSTPVDTSKFDDEDLYKNLI